MNCQVHSKPTVVNNIVGLVARPISSGKWQWKFSQTRYEQNAKNVQIINIKKSEFLFLFYINHLSDSFLFTFVLQKVTLWKRLYVIYSFFFVRKIVAHLVTFIFYCVVLPATVLVPEVQVPKWGAVYIPSIITLLNAVGTPRSLSLFLLNNIFSLF